MTTLSEVDIFNTLQRFILENHGARQDRAVAIRRCYQFIEKPEVFRWVVSHPRFLYAVLQKAQEFEEDMLGHGDVDVELMDAIQHVRLLHAGYMRSIGLSLTVGLISPNSQFSILDGATIRQIVEYHRLEIYIPMIEGEISKHPSVFAPAPTRDLCLAQDQLWETYRADPIHRWATIWMQRAIASIPILLPKCDGLYCDRCSRITYSIDGQRICSCGQGMYVKTLDGNDVPPWIDIDTYVDPVSQPAKRSALKAHADIKPS